jgi:hypothetical protein
MCTYTAPLGTTNINNLCSRCMSLCEPECRGLQACTGLRNHDTLKFRSDSITHLNADPDPTFHFHADPDPHPSDANLRPLTDSPRFHFEHPHFPCHCPSWLNLKSLKLHNFDFIVGSGSSLPNNADSCGSGIHSRPPPPLRTQP